MNFNENESFMKPNLKLQFIYKSQTKSKPVMRWSLRKKKDDIFYSVYFARINFLIYSVLNALISFISMKSALNALSEYTYFYISIDITSYSFLLVLKIVENFQCILKK